MSGQSENKPRHRVAALVPMRHHSERVPGKNYRLFAGRPLYHHIINTLLACPQIGEIVIDTDSLTIAEDAGRCFPSVTILERPQHLRADTIPMNEVLLNTVRHVSADFYLQTHSTNPLVQPHTIARALEKFFGSYPACDSLFSVTRYQVRLWDGMARPVNHDPAILLRTQDLPPLYEENSCLYIFTRATLETQRNRIGTHPLMFEMERLEAYDIDDLLGFEIAEMLFRDHMKKGERHP